MGHTAKLTAPGGCRTAAAGTLSVEQLAINHSHAKTLALGAQAMATLKSCRRSRPSGTRGPRLSAETDGGSVYAERTYIPTSTTDPYASPAAAKAGPNPLNPSTDVGTAPPRATPDLDNGARSGGGTFDTSEIVRYRWGCVTRGDLPDFLVAGGKGHVAASSGE